MTKREKLLEQYEDALFSLLMDEFAVCPPHQQRQAHFSIYLFTVHQSPGRNALQDTAPYQ